MPKRAIPVSPIADNIRGPKPETGVSSVALSERVSGRVRNREFVPVLGVAEHATDDTLMLAEILVLK